MATDTEDTKWLIKKTEIEKAAKEKRTKKSSKRMVVQISGDRVLCNDGTMWKRSDRDDVWLLEQEVPQPRKSIQTQVKIVDDKETIEKINNRLEDNLRFESLEMETAICIYIVWVFTDTDNGVPIVEYVLYPDRDFPDCVSMSQSQIYKCDKHIDIGNVQFGFKDNKLVGYYIKEEVNKQ